MAKYDDQKKVIELLRKAQEVESDRREKVREVYTFLNDPDGQWEDNVYESTTGRPRYSFDKCNDIVDDIAGEMEQADFDIKVKPAGGEATKDLAKTYDGIIRNIENLSNAVDVFNAAGRSMVAGGFNGWRVTQRWGDNNKFDQDLYIDTVADFVDRVWFDHNSVLQTREDAEYVFVLQSMDKSKYKEKFPDGSMLSIDSDSTKTVDRQPEVIIVGEFIYKVPVKRRIVEMTNGSVFVDNEKFKKIQDELQAQNVTVKRERNREMIEVKTRIFDGGGWLTNVQDTVFDYLPVIPTYGNWSMSKNVPSYWGIITKKMDAQRVYNYSESRKVEEGALAPLEKTVATSEQIGSHQNAWQNLNVSTDPVLPYVHQDNQPAPYKLGGAQINPGLESVSASALQNLQSTSGLDLLNGQSLGLQSGVAVELKQNKGDTRNFKYSASQERAICHTAKILIRAIPKVYDTERQIRIINEDKSEEMVFVNQTIIDEDTKEKVMLNDLSQGLYDVTCDVGPAFKNRQAETTSAFKEIAMIDPAIIQEGKDIWYGNMNAPGMNALAERARQTMVLAGQIPESQLTKDEKEFLSNQEPAPDPVAEALQRESDNADDIVELKGIEAARKDKELQLKIDQDQRDQASKSMEAAIHQMQELATELKTQTETLQIMRESGSVNLIAAQEAVVQDSQAEQV